MSLRGVLLIDKTEFNDGKCDPINWLNAGTFPSLPLSSGFLASICLSTSSVSFCFKPSFVIKNSDSLLSVINPSLTLLNTVDDKCLKSIAPVSIISELIFKPVIISAKNLPSLVVANLKLPFTPVVLTLKPFELNFHTTFAVASSLVSIIKIRSV